MTLLETSRIESAADQGLQKLIEGNRRFMRREARFPTVGKETLADLAKGQQPFATILGCSDSRVPPVAGNVISPKVMGSLQLLGHERCGAVKAALETKYDDREHRSHIQTLVNNILPGLPNTHSQISSEQRLTTAVEANVRWSIHQILESPEGRDAINSGIKLVRAVYEIASGHVHLLS